MFDNGKLGAYIHTLREGKGITESSLAKALGIETDTVLQWERGEAMPDVAMLARLARELGTTVDKILASAEDTPPPEEPEKEPPKVDFGGISDIIRQSVMGTLSELSEELQPVLETVREGIGNTLDEALKDAEESIKEVREAVQNPERVFVHVKTGHCSQTE